MNPFVILLLKRLPDLLPVVKTLLERRPPAPMETDDGRLLAVEQSLQLLAQRSDDLEARLKRMRRLVLAAGLLSLIALAVILFRAA